MDYRIRFSRAMFGDVIPLTRVAEGMAQRRASGYGKLPPHRPSFEAAKREFEKLLINAVTNGDLVACNQFGATGTIDQIVGADAHAAMNPGMSSISFLYAKSKHLCDWAAAIGDDFEFQDTGVEIVTTDHKDATGKIVEPGYSRGTLEAPRKPVQAADPTEDELTASHGPAKKRARAKKPTWLDVAQPYMQDLYNQGQFKSAQMFYERLYELAGTDNSPFEKGTGKRAWALFCREAGTFIERETLCPRRLNIDPPCRFNIDPGRIAAF